MRRPSLLAIAVLVGVIATAASAIGIATPSLWGDEIATLMSATRPDLWAMLGNVDAVHGAYYWFMHGWVSVFGTSPLALRAPSAVAVGIAASGVVVWVRQFRPLALAAAAGLVFAILPKVQELGGEARSYAITMAIVAWLLVLGVGVARRNSAWLWAGYAAALALGTVWFLYLPLVAGAQLVLIAIGHPAARRAIVAALVAAALAVSPFVAVALSQRRQVSWIAAAGVNGPQQILVEAWFGWWPLAVLGWTLMVIAVVRGVLGSAAAAHPGRFDSAALRSTTGSAGSGSPSVPRLRFEGPSRDALTMVAAATSWGPLIVLWALSSVAPVLSPRYLAMCLPSVAVLIALGLARLWQWRRPAAVISAAAVLALSVPVLVAQRAPTAKHHADWAQVAALIQAQAAPGDAVLFDESGEPWFRPRLALNGYPSAFTQLADVRGLGLTSNDVWDTNVRALGELSLAGFDRVWLVERNASADDASRAVLAEAGFAAGPTSTLPSSQVTEFTR